MHSFLNLTNVFSHVVDGALAFRRHHGKTRLGINDEIDSLNLVLTTYHTVSAEWKAEKTSGKSPLFSVRWRRIILDEGRCPLLRHLFPSLTI